MTLAELERGFELHEKRFARIEAAMESHEKRFARIEAAMEGHEKRLTAIEETQRKIGDNLLVQGEILNRLDLRLDRVAGLVEKNSADIQVMQSAMTSFFERMDAFIRGLGGNGHETPGAQ